MTTLDDILRHRDAAIAILERKIEEAIDLQSSGAQRMDATINALMEQRAYLAQQAFTAGLDAPTMGQALAGLNAATAEMQSVAARMVSATTFITNLDGLVNATNKAVSALKGTG